MLHPLSRYHETLGRFGKIFADYEPPEYEEITALKRGKHVLFLIEALRRAFER